jgi:hypothetical protein
MKILRVSFLFILVFVFVMSMSAFAQEKTIYKKKAGSATTVYSPYTDENMPTRIFWGDTHLHTRNSPDAGFLGNTLSPEDAYRFARGEEVTSSTGLQAKLLHPLDFLVVADHAEYFGLAPQLIDGDPTLLADPTGRRWYDMFHGSAGGGNDVFQKIIQSTGVEHPKELITNPAIKRTAWDRYLAQAESFNEPGRFTALIGFEWSSMIKGNNLHRVVVFRDGANRVNQVVPLSMFENADPEYLWKYMATYEKSTGGQVLAIPHNGNWSNGMMFALEKLDGRPLDRAYAKARMRWEPIYEVTQIKGDGETYPFLSAEDEFADFEPWDKANVPGTEPKEDWMLQYEYARPALMNGLALEAKLGVNPFKFGMIGSTDSHTSLATSREDNNFGKTPHLEPSANRATGILVKSPLGDKYTQFGAETSASGLAAVWARENTREAIWDAMKRKEVYATTGSRISVRVFGGWDFKTSDVESQDFAKRGYRKGVPMGGDLNAAPKGKTPSFMIRALRDPDNANLDRIQIIKGWVDKNNQTHERIFDVAVSDRRKIGPKGRCMTPVGSTVNVADASFENTIGDPLLTAFWKDPNFDPKQRAFYYVRVIEIPKPRWTAYDAKFYNVTMPEGTKMIVQDRAYTSPIWYTP